MGRFHTMNKLLLFAALVVCAAALPIDQDLNAQLVPSDADDKTAEALIDKAIAHTMDMNALKGAKGLGEVAKTESNDYAKETLASINKMSSSELKDAKSSVDDTLSSKFAADAKAAAALIKKAAAQSKKAPTKKHEKKMTAAQIAKVKAAGRKAEVALSSATIPVDTISMVENDFGADDMQLMGGSDADVEKAIEAAIGQKTNSELGETPEEPQAATHLMQFEKDKAEAARMVGTIKASTPVSKKAAARAKVMKMLADGQKKLASAQEADEDADRREANEEE